MLHTLTSMHINQFWAEIRSYYSVQCANIKYRKKTSNPWLVKLSWLANAHSHLLLSAGDLDELSKSGWPSFWCAIMVRQWVCMQDYMYLCTAVTTYASLVVPKLIRTFWPPVTVKSRSNPTLLYIHVRCTHETNLVTAGSRDTVHTSKYFCDRLKTDESRSGWPTFLCAIRVH